MSLPVLFLIPVVFGLVQLAAVLPFCFCLHRGSPHRSGSALPASPPAEPDKAVVTVILCTRGYDESLDACLNGLLNQQYEHYRIVIVPDSADDPSVAAVRRITGSTNGTPVSVTPLENPPSTCSRKIAGLLQAISTSAEETDVFVLVDSDTSPHPEWLCQLVQPFRGQEQVGVVTGNRWFDPSDRTAGVMVRYLWNAGAVPQMYMMRQPWGGSLAFRGEFGRRREFTSMLESRFGEDTSIAQFARGMGLSVVFRPQLMMVNSEQTSLSGVMRFLQRQMLVVRLHHPLAWATFGHMLLGASMFLVLPVIAVLTAGLPGLAVAAAGLMIEVMLLGGAVLLQQRAVNAALRHRGESVAAPNVPWFIGICLRIPLTRCCHSIASLAALLTVRHTWRGITYRFGRDPKVLVTAVSSPRCD